MVKDTTLYNKLEINPEASMEEIKKKGKKLLIKWHPDKHPKENQEMATKKFQEIQEAMSILENPEKRETYDKFGMDAVKDLEGMKAAGEAQGGGGFPFAHFASNFGGMGGMGGMGGFPFPDGAFGGFPFGGMGGPPNRGGQERENIIEKVDVTLGQIYREETINVKYNQKVTCQKCNGDCTNDGKKAQCNDCQGRGHQIRIMRMGPMVTQQMIPCTTCNAKGIVIPEENRCTSCSGVGYNVKEKIVPIQLKNGFGNGIKMQLEGKGNNLNGIKTDLVIILNEIQDKTFKRINNDLLVEIELKLYQALFGFDKVIEHLDGRKLHLHHTGKTNFGTIRKITGEGMSNLRTKEKGDLIIKFIFKLPNITNETLTKAIMLVDKPETITEKEVQGQINLHKTTMIDVSENDVNMKENDNEEEEGVGPKQAECIQQ